MSDLSTYTDDELRQAAGIAPDISSMSDDDLMKIAGQPADRDLSWRQGTDDTSAIDKVLNLFQDPAKEKAKATNAIINAEELGISKHAAYNATEGIRKLYEINPDRKQRRDDQINKIKYFHDMGGEPTEWMDSFLRNAKKLPYTLMETGGDFLRMYEESPEAAMASMGAMPTDQDREMFRLAAQAIEKKQVRTLGQKIGDYARKKKAELNPVAAPDSFRETVNMATESGLNNLMWLVPGFKFGRGATLLGMGLQATGQGYSEQREGGSSPSVAFIAGSGKGASEILTEFIPMGIYLKPKASFVRSLAAAEFTEVPTESINSIVNDVIDKVTIRPDMTVEDAIENIQTTIQTTILATVGISGVTYSANKVIGRALMKSEHAKNFDKAKNAALMEGETPQAALSAGVSAAQETAEGAAFVDQKLNEIKQAAQESKPAQASNQPFIFGVNEDANGEVTSFTMADPVSGQTFEVPALKSEDKDKLTMTPDMQAVNAKLKEIREVDQEDAALDKLIQGEEDIDQAAGKMFGETEQVEDVPDFAEDVKPETILSRVKAVNDKIGEKGSVDLTPLVDLGRSIWAEGHQTIEAFTARAKELLADVWDKVKDLIGQAWDTLNNERGSFSNKKKYDIDEVNELLEMAARQDKAQGELSEQPSYDEVRKKAAEMAFDKLQKKIDFRERKENAALKRQGKDDARQLPAFQAMDYISKHGSLNKSKLLKDYDTESIKEMSRRRINLIKENGTLELDVVADQLGFESADDLYNVIMDWQGLEEEGRKQSDSFMGKFGDLITTAEMDNFNEMLIAEEDKIMKSLTAANRPKPAKGLKTFIRQKTGQTQPKNKMVTEYDALAEAFRKEAIIARQAFSEGKKGEIEQSKEKMRWLMKRRESIKNVRDYFNLTDAEVMSVTNRRNPGLMDDAEFAQFLKDVELKAVLLAENKQAKIELMMLVESKRLKKVDNYRQAIQLPTIDKMTTEQLREFASLLEPFQNDDIFLTKRESETVDRTDLKGIKTIREAKERLAKEVGVDVEELNKVHVADFDSYRWDTSLRDRDPFFDILVSRMTEAKLGAELRAHNIETQVYELAKKSEKSRERGIIDRMIPQDDLIMAFLEAPMGRKAAIVEQMTPEQINYAHFMQQYFTDALNYLIATKSLERGRENYFVHIRKTFLENMKDGGLKKAVFELFKTYQQDQMVFNILDDDTGNILPLEKFFQFSLQRTDTMDPTRNVTKAFLTYMRTFEKKKMFDAIIPKLDIYAQALTPVKYTPRGLEIDRSLKTFVNKWINNKKGRRISFDTILRQGGNLDVGIRALRTFTTMLDLGFSPVAQVAAVLGEQVTNATMLGTRGMAKGTSRMTTDKGKRIIKKYESFVGRSLWEEFAAPGKEITERLTETLFAGFHASSVLANKQFLLASMNEQEFAAEEISPARLAEMQLDMGRFRVVPGTGSLAGSTSAGDALMQYKKWAVPLARTLITDAETLIGNIKEGKPLDVRAKKELFRFAYLTGAVFIVGAMAGADDDEDKSYIGKAKARLYREAMTLTQGINPLLFIGVPRTWTWLVDTTKALKSMILLEEYKTKDELKGPQELKRQFIPGAVRGLVNNEGGTQ